MQVYLGILGSAICGGMTVLELTGNTKASITFAFAILGGLSALALP